MSILPQLKNIQDGDINPSAWATCASPQVPHDEAGPALAGAYRARFSVHETVSAWALAPDGETPEGSVWVLFLVLWLC